MQPPVAAYLEGGRRLHLHHGPIDLIVGAEGRDGQVSQRAFDAAVARFQDTLGTLVSELAVLRQPLRPASPAPSGPVARRMRAAAAPFAAAHDLTPMIAVAGAVADDILATMVAAAPVARAYVNNGGDIAVHLEGTAQYGVAIADPGGRRLGTVRFGAGSGIGGVATSGVGGRSFSLGIADGVTVLGPDAATADTAATLIANAVDLPDHPGIRREPARDLLPDSDLGDRAVVTQVPPLSGAECAAALEPGRALAAALLDAGRIMGAALFLQGHGVTVGHVFQEQIEVPEVTDVRA